MEITSNRKRRSVKLTKEEVRSFNKYLNTFPTKFDASLAIGISRPTLNLVIIRGSGNWETIQKIRDRLQGASRGMAA